MKKVAALILGTVMTTAVATSAHAVIEIPQSALGSNGGLYYTDLVGGGLGSVAVMTGGGSGANIGNTSGRNDDGFMGPIAISPLTFMGSTYTSFYANNNGNVSFTGGISSYIPVGPTGATVPVISPFFADVDTRNLSSGVMYVRSDANQTIVTWDGVGYYSQHGSPLNYFQLVMRSDDYVVPVGEGRIGFFYGDMGWDVTDTSTTAAVGFGDGIGGGEVIAGSNSPGMAAVLSDHYIWFDENLAPVPNNPVPEPSTVFLLGAGLSGLVLMRRRMRK